MIEHPGGAGFLLEAAQAVGVARAIVGQQFDGHFAVEACVAGAPDFAHPARAEQGDDLVMTEASAGRNGHVMFLVGYRIAGAVYHRAAVLAISAQPESWN